MPGTLHVPAYSAMERCLSLEFEPSAVCQAAVRRIAAQWLPCPSLRMLPGCRKKALSRAAAIPVLISRLGAEEPETCWHAVAALRHMSALPDIRVSPLVGYLRVLACTVYTAHDFSGQAPASTEQDKAQVCTTCGCCVQLLSEISATLTLAAGGDHTAASSVRPLNAGAAVLQPCVQA